MSDFSANPTASVPLNTVLANTGQELERLAGMAANIDDHMGDLLLHPELAARLSKELMQDVDQLRQAVHCLYRLMTNIAGSGHAESTVSVASASEGVYLESIRTACLRAG